MQDELEAADHLWHQAYPVIFQIAIKYSKYEMNILKINLHEFKNIDICMIL